MKVTGIFFLILLLFSCAEDSDVCVSGDATPRMKIKFRDAGNLPLRLDSVYINVDYGNGPVNVVTMAKADSVLLPLRVDNNGFTEFTVRKTNKGNAARLKVSYTTQSKYVSPACGFKLLYENVSAQVMTPNPVNSTVISQTQITDESNVHLYLVF